MSLGRATGQIVSRERCNRLTFCDSLRLYPSMGALGETLSFLWLSSWSSLSRTGTFGAMSAGLALYGDVVSPARNAISKWTLAALALAAAAIVALSWLVRQHRPLVDIAPTGKRVLTPRTLSSRIDAVRDLAIFSLIAAILLGATWAGEKLVAGGGDAGSDDSTSFFATLMPELRGLRADVRAVREELSNVKRETSADPRKELANLGVAWTGDAMLEAVRTGDLRVLELFLAGKMNLYNASSQGRPLPVMLALNDGNAPDVLQRLLDNGLDINHVYQMHGGLGPVRTTLLGRAIERGNDPLALALLEQDAKADTPIQTFGAMGVTKNTFPLASAIQWQRLDVAATLLEHGADPAQGDYLAYREAKSLGTRVRSSADREKLDRLLTRLAPNGAAGAQIRDQLRLQEVNAELNQVALASLREMSGSSRRRALDQRYNELQRERAALQGRLSQ